MSDTAPASERLLRLPQVEAMTGLKRSALYSRIQKATFPAPLKIGERASAWPESAVQAWIQTQIRNAQKG
jgi:prophage regulatory protein